MLSAPIIRVSFILAVLVLVPGCRTSGPGVGGVDRRLPTGSGSDILAAAEIQTVRLNDAFEAVMRFRPEFLRGRPTTELASPNGALPVVYLNGIRQGGADVLRTIPIRVVAEIRYLTPSAGSEAFGRYHTGGVIAVRTRR